MCMLSGTPAFSNMGASRVLARQAGRDARACAGLKPSELFEEIETLKERPLKTVLLFLGGAVLIAIGWLVVSTLVTEKIKQLVAPTSSVASQTLEPIGTRRMTYTDPSISSMPVPVTAPVATSVSSKGK